MENKFRNISFLFCVLAANILFLSAQDSNEKASAETVHLVIKPFERVLRDEGGDRVITLSRPAETSCQTVALGSIVARSSSFFAFASPAFIHASNLIIRSLTRG